MRLLRHPLHRLLRHPPIRLRLTLWYAAIFSAIFGGVALFLVLNLRATLEANAEESLELTYRTVFDRLVDGGRLTGILHTTVIPGETGQPEVIGQILSADGRVLESSGQPTVAAPAVSRDVLDKAMRNGHWHGRARLRGRDHADVVIVVQFPEGQRAGSFLVLAQTQRPVTTATGHLMWLLFAAAPIALGVAGFGGWFVARAALRPVDELSRRAAAVDPAGPHEPLPVPAADDEISRLAVTLNGMLARLQRALDAERRFTADASHELRTPLAVIESELDVALRSPHTPAEARDVLRSVRTETSALGRIVNNLLLLARAEASGQVALDRRSCDLLEIVMGVATSLRPLAAEREVALRVDGDPTPAWVDADLIAQAVANLVHNGLSYTDAGGSVTVTARDGGRPRIEVTDTGVGITAEELPHIFDRFYRVDRSRARRRGGSGLGLEITRRIVDAHGGRIEVASTPGQGTTFVVTLPGTLAARAPAAGTVRRHGSPPHTAADRIGDGAQPPVPGTGARGRRLGA